MRVRAARHAAGPNAALFVDANGGYQRKQALELATRFREESEVSWFEEPVSSDDLEGMRLIRERGPEGMAIAAGEYGYDVAYFERMLDAGGVDILQADVTRCAGITELLRVDALCRARSMPMSLHCGPAIHLHAALALEQLVHLEYFHDHVRIEHLLFDGVVGPREGALAPDLTRRRGLVRAAHSRTARASGLRGPVAFDVLSVTGLLADHHHLGVPGAFAEDCLGRAFPQIARAAGLYRLA